MPQNEINDLYRLGSPSGWDFLPESRVDWILAKKRIELAFPNNPSVLDVGCFDGTFLANLDTSAKFGIEMNRDAAGRAMDRGIDILNDDYSSTDKSNESYDAITAFDVIEHTRDPMAFVRTMSDRLKEGGLLIISTGNLDAWSWRMARSRYWYCSLPEHLSFLSVRWFDYVAPELGLRIGESVTFAHVNGSLTLRIKEAAAYGLYLFAPPLARYLRAQGFGTLDASIHPEVLDFPPGWITARDHLLVVLEKSQKDALGAQ